MTLTNAMEKMTKNATRDGMGCWPVLSRMGELLNSKNTRKYFATTNAHPTQGLWCATCHMYITWLKLVVQTLTHVVASRQLVLTYRNTREVELHELNPLVSWWHCTTHTSLIERFMTSGTDRTQLGPMLAPWALLSGLSHSSDMWSSLRWIMAKSVGAVGGS